MPRITLLSDFGTRDGYVGAMKGVISSIFPGVLVDDISHSISPGDIENAALALTRYWSRYDTGTVHLAVVDPGVGTARRAIAVEADRRLFVAPDNGVLSRVYDAAQTFRIVEITNPAYTLAGVGHTFHGRDIFAPAAAFLARGVHLSLLGPEVHDPIRVGEPAVHEEEGALVGQVVSLDHFGNLVTNLRVEAGGDAEGVEVEGRTIPIVRTYGDVPSKEVAALVNSDGRIEVAARDSSAAELLNAGVGTPVRVRRLAAGTGTPEVALA